MMVINGENVSRFTTMTAIQKYRNMVKNRIRFQTCNQKKYFNFSNYIFNSYVCQAPV